VAGTSWPPCWLQRTRGPSLISTRATLSSLPRPWPLQCNHPSPPPSLLPSSLSPRYGDAVLHRATAVAAAAPAPLAGPASAVDFAAVVGAAPVEPYEVCRMFLASLQLAADRNLDFFVPGGSPGGGAQGEEATWAGAHTPAARRAALDAGWASGRRRRTPFRSVWGRGGWLCLRVCVLGAGGGGQWDAPPSPPTPPVCPPLPVSQVCLLASPGAAAGRGHPGGHRGRAGGRRRPAPAPRGKAKAKQPRAAAAAPTAVAEPPTATLAPGERGRTAAASPLHKKGRAGRPAPAATPVNAGGPPAAAVRGGKRVAATTAEAAAE
jgi:hypothetical protein